MPPSHFLYEYHFCFSILIKENHAHTLQQGNETKETIFSHLSYIFL